MSTQALTLSFPPPLWDQLSKLFIPPAALLPSCLAASLLLLGKKEKEMVVKTTKDLLSH